jgi:hypothetical protein
VKRNTNPSFVGIPMLKSEQRQQLESSSSRRPEGWTWARPATCALRSPISAGCNAEFDSLCKFGRDLIDRGEKMHYLRDLSWLFRG